MAGLAHQYAYVLRHLRELPLIGFQVVSTWRTLPPTEFLVASIWRPGGPSGRQGEAEVLRVRWVSMPIHLCFAASAQAAPHRISGDLHLAQAVPH